MIRQFSVLYVGQIELENVGRDGTPADARRYPNERLVEAYRTVVEVAQLVDEAGYYCLWTAEHHFQREGYEQLRWFARDVMPAFTGREAASRC